MKRWLPWIAWIAVATPALIHLVLLIVAIGNRFTYPYDLEWMEGGMLHHAHRIHEGEGLYGPPSVDFIPYLYTPLYPGLLAMLGSIFGLSYQLGRALSILSLIGIAAVTVRIMLRGTRSSAPPVRAAALAGALFALGLFAATYPFVEGWYDLVRADMLALFMVTAGLAMAHHGAREGEGWTGHGRTATAAALLALSFFCKQTGIFFVAAGGVIVLVSNWRRVPVYIAVAGAIGLGLTALLQATTGGWFWTYAYEIHQAHDWNEDRFWLSFEHILWRYPAMTVLIGITLLVVAVTGLRRRRLPAEARTFLVWTFVFGVSTLLGAVGWATEFAHFNAYMPALLHGAIAAGAAIPALAATVQLAIHQGDQPPGDHGAQPARGGLLIGLAVAEVAALVLCIQLTRVWWKPNKWIPKDSDRAAGDALIQRIAAVDGEVWVPSHPWYAHLAGKHMYVHRMGVKDVTARKPRPIVGLQETLERHRFAAVFLDNRDLHLYGEAPALNRYYQEADVLGRGAEPRTVTGAIVHPASIWVPTGPAQRPPGATVLFDFEPSDGAPAGWPPGWIVTGTAWGAGPVGRAIGKQAPVRRAGGRRWISSMHGDDTATGTLTSPEVRLDGPKLVIRLGGGTDDARLRVEILVGGQVVEQVAPPPPQSERFRDVVIELGTLRGQTVQLRFVDASSDSWGHLNADEIWLLSQ